MDNLEKYFLENEKIIHKCNQDSSDSLVLFRNKLLVIWCQIITADKKVIIVIAGFIILIKIRN